MVKGKIVDSQTAYWFFTFHLPEKDDSRMDEWADIFLEMIDSNDFPEYDFYFFAYEKGKKGETPHFQGAFHLTDDHHRWSTLRNYLQIRMEGFHLEPAHNWDACVNYCKKEHRKKWTAGECPKKGRRGDLADISKRLISGEITLDQVRLEYPTLYVQYGKRFHSLLQEVGHKGRATKVTLINSDVEHMAGYCDFVYTGSWAGYNGQKSVGILLDNRCTKKHVDYLASGKNPYVNVGYERIPFYGETIYWASGDDF